MKFTELMRVTKQDLIVSPMHEEWLSHNGNPTYSPEALDFMRSELAKQGRKRKGTVSASALDSCRRRQEFTFIGWPELPPSSKTAQIFHNGSFMHMRWQMAGLSAGWLAKAEVPVPVNDLNIAGTMDGIAHEGSIVELKSINTNGFGRVAAFGPQKNHRIQVGTYMYLSGVDKGCIVYEDKNTQEYREYIVEMDKDLEDLVTESAQEIWGLLKQEVLAEPLTDCEAKMGFRYQTCPYRDRCLTVKNYKEAEALA